MQKPIVAPLGALVLAVTLTSVRAQSTDSNVEVALMPRTMEVTLLNEGGKYVAVDLKHIPQGGVCRMEEGAVIVRVGPGATPGATRVRYAAPQLHSGGCPFMTAFDLTDSDYAAGRAAFQQMKNEANSKVEQLKKDLGEKWDELTGKKS